MKLPYSNLDHKVFHSRENVAIETAAFHLANCKIKESSAALLTLSELSFDAFVELISESFI